jgi:MFS family permease
VEGPTWGWRSAGVLSALGAAVVLAPIFVAWSRRQAQPLIDLALFRIDSFRLACTASLLVSAIGSSTWLLWPLFLRTEWNYSPIRVGLAMSVTPLIGGVGSVLAARYAARHGHRRLLVTGSALLTLACVCFALLPSSSPAFVSAMLPGLVLTGLGLAMTFAPLNAAALVDVPHHSLGQANAAFSTGRFLSGALGVAVAIAILGGPGDPIENYTQTYLLLAAVAAVAGCLLAAKWHHRPAQPR